MGSLKTTYNNGLGNDEVGEWEDVEVEVEEHKLADGTDVLKDPDGTLYDPESLDIVGLWNETDNTLIGREI